MILEGLVTTTGPDGSMHVAAMGPEVDAEAVEAGRLERLLLKPFPTSHSAANLARVPAGVFHAVDDALLLARIVAGVAGPPPASRPATTVPGFVLDAACRAWEFEVIAADTSEQRQRLEARVVAVHEGRPFMGLNRGTHAVVEAAILVTRLHLLGKEEVNQKLRDLSPLVEKTGGPREREAFGLLVARAAAS